MKHELNFWVVGGDMRQVKLAQLLSDDGHTVHTYALDPGPEPVPGLIQEQNLNQAGRADCVVLPLTVSTGGGLLNAPLSLSEHPLAPILDRLAPRQFLCGGRLDPETEALARERGLIIHDYFAREELAVANAVPTAEGAIALAMDAAPITLHGARCLVIGFGRIGKALAPRLHALSAAVTVSVRRPADEGLVEALGLTSERTGRYLHGLSQYDFIFNTVPSPILDRAQLGQLSADCTLIDLSSPPYGIAPELCRALGRKCIYASGLPGKCAPKTAGILYARQIITESEESE